MLLRVSRPDLYFLTYLTSETYTRFNKNSILETNRRYYQLYHSFIDLVLITYRNIKFTKPLRNLCRMVLICFTRVYSLRMDINKVSTRIALNQLVVKISTKFLWLKKVNLTPGLYTSLPVREFHYPHNNSSSFSMNESCGLKLGHGCRYRKFPVLSITMRDDMLPVLQTAQA
jgi:hypothetical protein